ncbi:transglycosylase domain-containing protein [Streptomyces thermolilacinus]|uniref:transglycosylase domain-containing protein n=1 Tax=Streptomyces thermolilacinus TaxID=285540 RepID=UPI0003C76530|nr:transglycosylase domain-containing protein [Streptomyces thermolilacinus]
MILARVLSRVRARVRERAGGRVPSRPPVLPRARPGLRVDYPRRGRRGAARFLPSWRQLLALALLGLTGAAGLLGWLYVTTPIPDVNAGASSEATVYYWADGSRMVSVGPVNRQNVPLSDIPGPLRDAVIATENATFYSDPGFSVRGLVRAVVNTARGGELEGGSTITQQYVKNTYLTQERTLSRKLRELCLSVKLSRSLAKDEILQGYLNTSWFGRDAYGVQAAAVAYYGTDARNLDPSQGALLAALLKGGDFYDPELSAEHRRRAEARWRYVLDRQVELGFMTRAQRAAYADFPEPRSRSVASGLAGQTGYLVDAANKDLRNRTGLTAEELGRGGYRVRTTFERAAVDRLRRAVEGVAARAGASTGGDGGPGGAGAGAGGPSGSGGETQFGAASVRPGDGAVLALYGGPDATRHFTSNADTAGVPAGSAFTPFVMAAALRQGVRGHDGTDGAQALRRALVRADADVFLGLGEAVGLDRVRDVAVGAGLLPGSMAALEPPFALGTSTPSAIRMAGAYGTFATGGLRAEPYSVTAVAYRGAPLEGLERPAARQVLEPDVAREVARGLRDVAVDAVDPDTLRALGPVAAARTSGADRAEAVWFVGYGEDLSTAVTVFRTGPRGAGLLPLTEPDAGELPLRAWSAYMTASAAGAAGRTS